MNESKVKASGSMDFPAFLALVAPSLISAIPQIALPDMGRPAFSQMLFETSHRLYGTYLALCQLGSYDADFNVMDYNLRKMRGEPIPEHLMLRFEKEAFAASEKAKVDASKRHHAVTATGNVAKLVEEYRKQGIPIEISVGGAK